MKQTVILVLVLLGLNSCYSGYKIMPPAVDTGSTVKITEHVDALSLFPVIPRTYRAAVRIVNSSDTTVCLSNVHATLTRSSGKKETMLKNDDRDSLMITPGGRVSLNYTFKKTGRVFFPHRVCLSFTANMDDHGRQDQIRQTAWFRRYMYVNIAGN